MDVNVDFMDAEYVTARQHAAISNMIIDHRFFIIMGTSIKFMSSLKVFGPASVH